MTQIYHAQAAYHGQTKHWARNLDELKLTGPVGLPPHQVELKATPDGFVLAVTFTPAGGKPQTWTIRQDSRLLREDKPPK